LYGFRKVFRGEDKDCFFHALFQKDRSDLLPGLKRPPLKKRKKPQSRSKDDDIHEKLQESTEKRSEKFLTTPSESKQVPAEMGLRHIPAHNLQTGFITDELLLDGIAALRSSSSSFNQPSNHPFHLPVPYSHALAHPFPNTGHPEIFQPSSSTQSSFQAVPNLPYNPYIPPYSPWWYYARNSESRPQVGLESPWFLTGQSTSSMTVPTSVLNEENSEYHPPTTENDNSQRFIEEKDD
jgi:hypothetical protein